jgi:adenine phosphoribosyltransferase
LIWWLASKSRALFSGRDRRSTEDRLCARTQTGKLPSKTRTASYSLEYGTDSLQVHEDAATKGQRVLIVDDLLATGGTAAATVSLIRGLGADVVGVQFSD